MQTVDVEIGHDSTPGLLNACKTVSSGLDRYRLDIDLISGRHLEASRDSDVPPPAPRKGGEGVPAARSTSRGGRRRPRNRRQDRQRTAEDLFGLVVRRRKQPARWPKC